MKDAIVMFLWREGLRFIRQKGRLFATLATPVGLWLILGHGFGSLFEDTYLKTSSLEYFFPGILVMTILFASIFSMISVIEDRNEGFLQGVMLVPRAAEKIVLGKVIATLAWSLVQVAIVLLLAPTVGLHLSWSVVVELLLILGLASMFLSLVGFLFAWYLNSIQGFHSVMNLVLLPLWVLSGALFPMDTASSGMRLLMQLNPLSHAVDLLNKIFISQYSLFSFFKDPHVWFVITLMGSLIAMLFAICLFLVKRVSVKSSGVNASFLNA